MLDDDRDWADALALVLTGAGGFLVEPFSLPRDALRRLTRAPAPDVTVVDYTMPEIDGCDFCIAAARISPRMPLVLVTAAAEIDAGTRRSCVAVIPKPVDLRLLIATVQAACEA